MNRAAGRLEQLARDALKLGAEMLDPKKSLIDDYGLDSLTLTKLLIEIEGAFDIQIRDEDLNIDNFDSLETILRLLEGGYGICTTD